MTWSSFWIRTCLAAWCLARAQLAGAAPERALAHLARLTAPDGVPGDFFGERLAMSAETLVVGAPFRSEGGSNAGAVYIFRHNPLARDQWEFVTKVRADDAGPQRWFGFSIAIHKDTLAVGSPFELLSARGSVYVFERDQGGKDHWGQVKKITTADVSSTARFGDAIAISGNTLAVGAPYDDAVAARAGSAFIFERDSGGPDNWGQVKRLDTATAVDGFGWAIGLSNATLAVGAPGDDSGGQGAGAIYVFDREQGGPGNWGRTALLTADGGDAGDGLGVSVALDAGILVGGAPQDEASGVVSGSVYIFARDDKGNWGQSRRLHPSGVSAFDEFGRVVAVRDKRVAVGVRNQSGPPIGAGSVYVFERNLGGADSWGQADRLTADASGVSAGLGSSVALNDDILAAGAPVGSPGVVLVFGLEPVPVELLSFRIE